MIAPAPDTARHSSPAVVDDHHQARPFSSPRSLISLVVSIAGLGRELVGGYRALARFVD